MTIASEIWHKHPDELEGKLYAHYMALDFMALNLIRKEEIDAARNSNG